MLAILVIVPFILKNIATVENTLVDRFGFNLRNGQPSYYFTLKRQNDANTVALLDEINVAIKELNEGPLKAAGLTIDLSFDSSVHIRNALSLVQNNLGLGVLLALGILWLFLRGPKNNAHYCYHDSDFINGIVYRIEYF